MLVYAKYSNIIILIIVIKFPNRAATKRVLQKMSTFSQRLLLIR